MEAKVTPVKFFQQVRQEAGKVTWPTRKEALTSTAMTLVMVVIASAFFLLVDWAISAAVRAVLGI